MKDTISSHSGHSAQSLSSSKSQHQFFDNEETLYKSSDVLANTGICSILQAKYHI